MSVFDHPMRELVHAISVQIAARLVRPIRAIIRKELYVMTDAVDRLSAQTDATLATVTDLLTEVQKDVALLASSPKDDSAALDAITSRLKSGTDAAKQALAALQNPPASTSPAEPAPSPESPAPEAPAADPAPVTA